MDPAPEASALVPPTPAPAPGPLATPSVTKTRAASAAAPDGIGDYGVWSRLCDCESGKWDRHGNPIPGSGRWDYHEGYYEGGLHFAPSTWDGYRPPDYPDHAADATAEQQIEVGKRVLRVQGPGAWPVCSKTVGLTRAAA